jgi:hypothetical protein
VIDHHTNKTALGKPSAVDVKSVNCLSLIGSVTAAAAAATGSTTVATAASATAVTATAAAFATRGTSTAASATAVTAAAAAAAAGLARLSFAYAQRTTFEVFAIERINRGLAFGRVGHGDETESATAAGLTIHDNLGTGDRAMGCEHIGQAFVVDRPRQVADVEFHGILASGANTPLRGACLRLR